MFDFLIVGAGVSGAVLAERLASQLNKRCLVVDRRPHVGGTAYDYHDDAGLLVHRYGPHIFHTNSKEVFDYLSGFTLWRPYEHQAKAFVDGQLVPMPINLDTIHALTGLDLSPEQFEAWLAARVEPIERPRTAEERLVSRVGRELYEKLFQGYMRKHWGLDPSQLDASVAANVVARLDRDPRYFPDLFQFMPLHGYTRMFQKMLDHPNIQVLLSTDYRAVMDCVPFESLVYTGPLDAFFGYRHGPLPYRSLDFVHQTFKRERYQDAPTILYPNEQAYTRVTEFKYLTGQRHAQTSIVMECSKEQGEPYHPIPRPENAALYRKYRTLALAQKNVHFVGWQATYSYYNMDQCVAQALATFRKIARTHTGADRSEPRA